MPNTPTPAYHVDREFRHELRQQEEWPENTKFPNDPDPGDGGIMRLNAGESLSPTFTVAWTCTQSRFAG